MKQVMCRNCGYRGRAKLRKNIDVQGTIKHKYTGKEIPWNFRLNARSEKDAAATGIPCPKCGKHKLTRKRRFVK
jgi:predicted RNA-binding Zn-ribbon protein involved in translation (DUF1610 family)